MRPRSARAVIVSAEPADLTGQLRPAAVDPGFDRSFRETKLVRDFLIRQLLDVSHENGCPERFRECNERLTEQGDAIALLERGHRPRVHSHG